MSGIELLEYGLNYLQTLELSKTFPFSRRD